MNNIEYKNIIEDLEKGFINTKGKGYCFLYKPVNISIVLMDLIIKMVNKNENITILIGTEEYSFKEELLNTFKEAIEDYDERQRYIKNIKFLSSSYLKINKTLYGCFISVGINDNIDELIRNAKLSKFSLFIFNTTILNSSTVNKIEEVVKLININIDTVKLLHNKIYSPVEEYRYGVPLNDEDSELNKKYDNYIRDSLSIFGDLDTIQKCRIGDAANHMSSMDCCYEVARRNGWSPTMDNTIEYNKQVDAMFNPISLKERIASIFNITNLRKKLVTDNNNKLETIKNIIIDNPNKKILIVCLRGEFANSVSKYLTENNISNVGYHNDLEDSYLTDQNGEIICYKSGENKGKPKVFKSAALSKNNLLYYNANMVNVLIIKGSTEPDIETTADIIIYTTPLLDNIFAFKRRFSLINIKTPTIVHKIYCIDTIEEKTMLKEKQNSLINIHNENFMKNLQIDEISGDIIL